MSKPYNWDLITTAPEAEAVKEFAELEVEKAKTRLANVNLRTKTSGKSLKERNDDLQSKRAELASVVSQQGAITDNTSAKWKKLESERKSLDSDVYDLELSLETSSGVNVILQTYGANGQEFQLTEATALLAGAEAKLAALS